MTKRAILLLTLLLCACNSSEDIKEFELTHKMIGETATVAKEIVIVDDLLIAKSTVGIKRGEESVSIYEMDHFTKCDSCDVLGVAGGRFSSSSISYGNYNNDELSLYNSMDGKLKVYKVADNTIKDSTVTDLYASSEFSPLVRIHELSRYNDDYSVGLVFRGDDKMFALFDNDYKRVSYFGDHPYGKLTVATFNLYYDMNGFFKVNGDHIIYAPSNVPYLSCYTIKDGVPTKLWENQYNQEFVYEVVKGKMNIDKYQHGYLIDVALGKEYIYLALYTGLKIDRLPRMKERSDADKILVFDYAGNSVATLNLDDKVHSIALSQDEKELYSIVRPGSKVFVYEIPSFE